jgi:general secretion pathway protein D
MITKISKMRWLLLLLLCLLTANGVYAQRAGGGGAGGGGGGGGGGNIRGGGAGASSSSSGTSSRDYPNSTMPGPVTVTVDPETHRVIILTDDATFTNVSQVIASLDKPKPQVLINAVFLEVTHVDDLDFGVEGTYNHNPAPSTLNSLGLSNIFGLAGQGSAASTIGANTMPIGAGLYSVVGQDFQATVRAIASATKAQVLSRPSVLVRNNQPATITVGQSVPLVTGVTFPTVASAPISTIQYQNVGIILQVTPFITADGLVEMIVAPQISSLAGGPGVQIAANTFAPIINLRSASTVVVTPDGQTVIIGGLMEHDRTTVDTKIPILGDIPGLGALFRRKQKDNTKTELLIFITPHVVAMPSQLASTTSNESDKAELSRKAFNEQELNHFFDTVPLKPPAKSGKP